jgi:hypothetical protein
MKTKKPYTTTSFFDFLFLLLLEMRSIVLFCFCIYMYNENPFVFIILGIIAFAIFILSGEEEIINYEDRIEQKTNSFNAIIFKTKAKSINLNSILNAYIEENPSSSKAEMGVALLLSVFFSSGRLRHTQRDILQKLKLKNEKMKI